MAFSAKEVQVLRQATGAGMMDCKKALEEANGDLEAAKLWLREKGLSASAKRDDRDNAQGVVALLVKGNVGAMVKLKCETDFVASSDGFKAEADALVALVLEKGEASIAERATKLEDLKILLKEKMRSVMLFVSKVWLAAQSVRTRTFKVVAESTVCLLK